MWSRLVVALKLLAIVCLTLIGLSLWMNGVRTIVRSLGPWKLSELLSLGGSGRFSLPEVLPPSIITEYLCGNVYVVIDKC